MPPASHTPSASSKSKASHRNASPDVETAAPEQETQSRSSKKKNKNAAAKQAQISSLAEQAPDVDVTRDGEPPPVGRPDTILNQIPHAFAASRRRENLLDVEDEVVNTTGKVSDQYTPPQDDWLEDAVYEKSPPVRPAAKTSPSPSPPAEPGFSTRARYDSKSPPVSPPSRYARPVSYGGGRPSLPPHSRTSTSPYTFSTNAYGSPPAPHMPQPHFYRAQDVNLGLPPTNNTQPFEEPRLMRHTKMSSGHGPPRQGILLGFEGRLNVLRLENGAVEEIGAVGGLSGVVIDAVLLEWNTNPNTSVQPSPLVAVVVHGPKEGCLEEEDTANRRDSVRNAGNVQGDVPPEEYSTRVELWSLSTQTRLAVLLETPPQAAQPAFRGAPSTPPSPVGQLRLQASRNFLVVVSGSSGEVYAFTTAPGSQFGVECVAKVWTALQPQLQRRDSSHLPNSDADMSPADLGRAAGGTERGIASVSGRWLAVCPATSPSRPSLGAVLGPTVRFGRHAGVETTSAPTRPSVTCEVDSPDADTLFGKVARGVAQELVKGAKWLGDQGYLTWQNYWKKEQSQPALNTQPAYSPPAHPPAYSPNSFPPTHGEASTKPKEPDLVAIYDLQATLEVTGRKSVDESRPVATFQPPRGCSFVSFAPHGLNLLTAGKKGDVQYVWDLMQIKHCRTLANPTEDDRLRAVPRVRQVAKFERLSGSTIVDVVWDAPTGARFAVLTKNKTIHLFDLPSATFRWPPARTVRSRPVSKPVDSAQHEAPAAGGFLASAMNIANQAQPILANWRGRAPSMGGGLAGIGQTGIGLASATGARGGKAVAAGLSKSLGAASETVSQIRHAGESRLPLKSSRPSLPGKMFWTLHGRRTVLVVLDTDTVKQYQVRRNKGAERRDKDVATVFEARKAMVTRLPRTSRLDDDTQMGQTARGFWGPRTSDLAGQHSLSHPLSSAEIETNAPYQPFHSDRRVNLCIYSDSARPTESQLAGAALSRGRRTKDDTTARPSQWVFGDDIPAVKLNVNKVQISDDENTGSVIYRETTKVSSAAAGTDDMDQIVSTTRRRKVKKGARVTDETNSDGEREDGFFEDDCDVLDFATDRV